jgi:hypothetical protein
MDCSASKISRIETGRVAVSPRDVRELLRIYGVSDDQHGSLIQLARESRRKGRLSCQLRHAVRRRSCQARPPPSLIIARSIDNSPRGLAVVPLRGRNRLARVLGWAPLQSRTLMSPAAAPIEASVPQVHDAALTVRGSAPTQHGIGNWREPTRNNGQTGSRQKPESTGASRSAPAP